MLYNKAVCCYISQKKQRKDYHYAKEYHDPKDFRHSPAPHPVYHPGSRCGRIADIFVYQFLHHAAVCHLCDDFRPELQQGKIFSSDISGSSNLAKISVTLFQNSDKITALYDGCKVSFSVEEGTFYITISVTGSDPEKCANVANQISDMCNEVFQDNFAWGQLGIIRTAKVPAAPISPDKMRNTLIGFVVGLIAACVIAILLELIDTTIKSDEDLAELYKIPVFAEIPDFENGSR